jgi:hypothetical protein
MPSPRIPNLLPQSLSLLSIFLHPLDGAFSLSLSRACCYGGRTMWAVSCPETCEFTKKLKLLFLMQGLARAVAFMLPCIIFVLLSVLVTECHKGSPPHRYVVPWPCLIVC